METTPEIENKYTELSSADKLAEIEKIKATLSKEEIEKVFTINSKPSDEVKPVPVPAVAQTAPIKLDPQIEMVAQTLMSQQIERVKNIYADFDLSGITNANVDTLTKVTLMSTFAEPNARKMATIEKNLKSNEAEGTVTKPAQFSAPATAGKVDEKAGEKLFTEMSQKLGFSDEESN